MLKLCSFLRFSDMQITRQINPFPNNLCFFMCLQYKSFENAVGKGEIARNEQFLLFPQCFLPVWITFVHFDQNKNCCLQTLSVWKNLKFVVWERVFKVIRPSLNHFIVYSLPHSHWNFIDVIIQWPGCMLQVIKCLHLHVNFSERWRDCEHDLMREWLPLCWNNAPFWDF